MSISRPLESDISNWDYELLATDNNGARVSERIDIHVQHHKLSRSVNHEFSIHLEIKKQSAYPTYVDWALRVSKND